MIDTHQNGAVSETMVQARLYEEGYAVSVPCSEEPYDLIVDIEGELLKVQVKTLYTRTRCSGRTSYRAELRPKSRGTDNARYSAENVDAFAVYNSDDEEVYWLWFDEAPATEASRKVNTWRKDLLTVKLDEYTSP